VCDCVWECNTTLNSERKRARGDRYAPVCSRWLTKRLVKRLLTAAVTAAASVGGRRPPIGRRSRPTGDDLLPPAIQPFAYARTHVYDITGLSLPAATSPTTSPLPYHTRADPTQPAKTTTPPGRSRPPPPVQLTTTSSRRSSCTAVKRLPTVLLLLPNRSYFCRASFTVSFERARPRRFAPHGIVPIYIIKYKTYHLARMALWESARILVHYSEIVFHFRSSYYHRNIGIQIVDRAPYIIQFVK